MNVIGDGPTSPLLETPSNQAQHTEQNLDGLSGVG